MRARHLGVGGRSDPGARARWLREGVRRVGRRVVLPCSAGTPFPVSRASAEEERRHFLVLLCLVCDSEEGWVDPVSGSLAPKESGEGGIFRVLGSVLRHALSPPH